MRLRMVTTRLLQLVTLSAAVMAQAGNPEANPDAVIVSGNARFTVLKPEMIRIEYSDKGVFEDRATFTVVNRAMDVTPAYNVTEDSVYLYISTDKLALTYRKGTYPRTLPASPENLSVSLTQDGHTVMWYPGKPDPLNLKGTCRTLDGSNGDNKRAELEDGLISRSGWAVIDDSWTAARPDGSRSFALEANPTTGYDWWAERNDPHAMDLYFMGYGKDYRKALADFTELAGKIPLPPAYVFGYWYSKYASYSADDYRSIMADLRENAIPADVMILDMDWHWNGDGASMSAGRGGWTGWSWNTNLIPEPEKLLEEIHANNFKIALNLHPADGINKVESPEYYTAMNTQLGGKYENGGNIAWSLDFPDFTKAFFNTIIRDHEGEGVDFWWLDWQQHLTSPYTQGLGQTFWCNHVFYNDMVKNRPDRRPVIFHRWGGLGSHRYQIGFSGDALINFPTLAFQPYFTATASNVGYAFWGHELGGHAFTDENIVNDPELVLRWIQFGVFTPIFRTHATKDDRIERRMWKFPNFPLMRDAVRLRYSLFPYIYTAARATYDTGIGMCRPMYYDFPESEEAYTFEGQYMFGDNILVAPVTEASSDHSSAGKEIWFPAGEWWDVSHGSLIEGPCVMTIEFTQDEIPYFFRAGSMIPFNPSSVMNVTERPDKLILKTIAGTSGEGSLYEDKGDNSDYASVYSTTKFSHIADGLSETYLIEPRSGNADGLQARRAWTMEIYNASPAAEVRRNGATLDKSSWTYDPATRMLIINLPEEDCSKQISVDVTYMEESDVAAVRYRDARLNYDKSIDSLVIDLGAVQKSVKLVISDLGANCRLKRDYSNVAHLTEPMRTLGAGVYICRVETDKEVTVKKFIK